MQRRSREDPALNCICLGGVQCTIALHDCLEEQVEKTTTSDGKFRGMVGIVGRMQSAEF